MCLLIETLKISQGQIQNLVYHNRRFNKTQKDLFNTKHAIDLSQIIDVKQLKNNLVYKCRVIYNAQIQNIEFEVYVSKLINTVQLVTHNSIEYSFKYKNRTIFETLKNEAQADEILIVKNGEITDFSFANVVFYTKDNKAFTPQSPLLKGTKRQFLIDMKLIAPLKIQISDLSNYRNLKPINALLDFDKTPLINIKNIF
jgi:4-amino-4-deoxychorismate lyase